MPGADPDTALGQRNRKQLYVFYKTCGAMQQKVTMHGFAAAMIQTPSLTAGSCIDHCRHT